MTGETAQFPFGAVVGQDEAGRRGHGEGAFGPAPTLTSDGRNHDVDHSGDLHGVTAHVEGARLDTHCRSAQRREVCEAGPQGARHARSDR